MNIENTNDDTATEGCAPAAGSAVDAAITLANASCSWLQQEPAMKRFVELCPEDGQRTIVARALKVLADEVTRLRALPNVKGMAPGSAVSDSEPTNPADR